MPLVEEHAFVGEMVLIPGGSFRMGDLSGEGDDDEQPVRTLTVRPFWLGKYEVTFAQWDACWADRGCRNRNPDFDRREVVVADDHGRGRGHGPVSNVDRYDAQLYIDWLNSKTNGGYRLPSEAEWEYAARTGGTTEYGWGNDVGSNRANCDNDDCGDRYEYTAPVGSFPANAWGLHDMHGNVWEWVQDCRHDSYAGAPNDGSAWMNTKGGCDYYVIRGGSWQNGARVLRSANRAGRFIISREDTIGFRVARDP